MEAPGQPTQRQKNLFLPSLTPGRFKNAKPGGDPARQKKGACKK